MYLFGVELHMKLAEGYSLKDKRRIIKSIIERMQSRYKMSASEVDEQDTLNLAVVGLGLVSSSYTKGKNHLEKAVDYIEESYPVEVFERYYYEGEEIW